VNRHPAQGCSPRCDVTEQQQQQLLMGSAALTGPGQRPQEHTSHRRVDPPRFALEASVTHERGSVAETASEDIRPSGPSLQTADACEQPLAGTSSGGECSQAKAAEARTRRDQEPGRYVVARSTPAVSPLVGKAAERAAQREREAAEQEERARQAAEAERKRRFAADRAAARAVQRKRDAANKTQPSQLERERHQKSLVGMRGMCLKWIHLNIPLRFQASDAQQKAFEEQTNRFWRGFAALAKEGQVFVKHGRNDSHECKLTVCLLNDMVTIEARWGEGDLNMQFRQGDAALLDGKQTDVFKRGQAAKAPANLCFSLVNAKRSLDLQASDQASKDLWYRGLKLLVLSLNQP
jgi:hypothetical protein